MPYGNINSICENKVISENIEASAVGNCVNLLKLRSKCPKNVIVSYVNINSIRSKLQNLEWFIKKSVDVLAIAETKLDDSFPDSQFLLEGYKKPYRLDVNACSMGVD